MSLKQSSKVIAKQQVRHKEKKKDVRVVGRWIIGETLGKGGYSWVKKGYDRKTGKVVALKFMSKASKDFEKDQQEQVENEIESLRHINHKNVIRLYAYNINAKYPNKNKHISEVILLVLEYASGGELFDILYYTEALEENIARSYFRQMIEGLQACHSAGIAHRDIKPQNLLLDRHFNLKITDFGLSKVLETEDETMSTYYVGTRGFQAPELLLKKNFTMSCDIFSAGVVLFILLTGYPPFEHATKRDRWYHHLIPRKRKDGKYAINIKKFWSMHRGCGVKRDAQVLITSMLSYIPKQRPTIEQIKQSIFFKGEFLEGQDLKNKLRSRHRLMEIKRRSDAEKTQDLQHSIVKRDLPGYEDLDINASPPALTEETNISFTSFHTTMAAFTTLNYIHCFVENQGGAAIFNKDEFELVGTVHCLSTSEKEIPVQTIIKFQVNVYKDLEKNANLVSFKRLMGNSLYYTRLLRTMVAKCGAVLTGLPNENPLKPEEVIHMRSLVEEEKRSSLSVVKEPFIL